MSTTYEQAWLSRCFVYGVSKAHSHYRRVLENIVVFYLDTVLVLYVFSYCVILSLGHYIDVSQICSGCSVTQSFCMHSHIFCLQFVHSCTITSHNLSIIVLCCFCSSNVVYSTVHIMAGSVT
jgi:hypothetical protein